MTLTVGTSVAPAGEGVRFDNALIRHRPIPPIAKATARPAHGDVPLHVAFSAKGSRALAGTIKAYRWNFGDGSRGSGKRPRHTYRRSGRYSVRLTVIERSGATTFASTMVTVGPLAAAKPSKLINLGNARVGKHARRQIVKITNPGRKPLKMRRIRILAGALRDIRITHNRCRGRTLHRRQSCTFTATMVPTARGPRLTEVAIIANTGPVAQVSFIATGT